MGLLDRLTLSTDLSHRTPIGLVRPASSRSSLVQGLYRCRRKTARARHSPVRSASNPSYVSTPKISSRWRRKEGYPDHGEKDGGGTERNLGWCGVCGILHDGDDINGRVQQRESILPRLLFLGLCGHGRNPTCDYKEAVLSEDMRKNPNLGADGRLS